MVPRPDLFSRPSCSARPGAFGVHREQLLFALPLAQTDATAIGWSRRRQGRHGSRSGPPEIVTPFALEDARNGPDPSPPLSYTEISTLPRRGPDGGLRSRDRAHREWRRSPDVVRRVVVDTRNWKFIRRIRNLLSRTSERDRTRVAYHPSSCGRPSSSIHFPKGTIELAIVRGRRIYRCQRMSDPDEKRKRKAPDSANCRGDVVVRPKRSPSRSSLRRGELP